jgi:hypothetical protein
MLYRYRHIITFSLLFCYLFLGVAGYLETIVLSGFGSNPRVIAQSNCNPPPTFKVYYTQHKHIPTTVKVSVPSAAVFTPPEMPHAFMYGTSFTQCECGIFLDQSFSLHSSRAPPQV